MSAHTPPCTSGTQHLALENAADGDPSEPISEYVARFVADREAEIAAARETLCAEADWAPGEYVEAWGR